MSGWFWLLLASVAFLVTCYVVDSRHEAAQRVARRQNLRALRQARRADRRALRRQVRDDDWTWLRKDNDTDRHGQWLDDESPKCSRSQCGINGCYGQCSTDRQRRFLSGG